MICLLPIITSLLYRLRGTQRYDWLGKTGLCAVVAVFLNNNIVYIQYVPETEHDLTVIMYRYLLLFSCFLTGVYLFGITSIFGSINPYAEKDCCGLKGKILKFGYKHSIYWTNFIGLTITGLLQLSPLYVVSWYFAAGSVLMPICYTVAVKWLGDTKWAEYGWGGCQGCLMLAAVIGG